MTISSKPCVVTPAFPATDNSVVCIVPSGMGDRNRIKIRVGNQISGENNATNFAYDPPIITQLVPNTPNAAVRTHACF